MDLSYVMPLFAGKIIPRRVPLHIFGKQDVRIIVKLDKGHCSPLVLSQTEGISNWLSEHREYGFRIGGIGRFFIPVVVVEAIAVCTAPRSDVVMHSVFVEVTIDRDLGVAC